MWNNNLYFGGSTEDGIAAQMEGLLLRSRGAADPAATILRATPEIFGFPGPTPSVSANGTSNAIVWIIETDTYQGGNAVLRAYDANNLATEFYNSNQNPARDRREAR